jgi:glycosyltransferase involved in cell wall biosynthesis
MDLGLSDRIFFAGFQSNPYAFLACAELYVLSSGYEGMLGSLLEAMACGLPVIAAECQSGSREILKAGSMEYSCPSGTLKDLLKRFQG